MVRVHRALALCAAACAVASIARAQVIVDPDPSKSSLSSRYFAVEGQTSGLPDNCADARCGLFTVTARDFSNTPVPGVTVQIDFSGCPDIAIACDQLTAVTGQTYLGGKLVQATTNASGQALFQIQGASSAVLLPDPSLDAGANAGVPCAVVSLQGTPLASVTVAAYDINGLGSPTSAVNASDASFVMAEALKVGAGATPRARDDYNNSNNVNAADVALSIQMALQAAQGTGSKQTGPYCP